MWLTETGGIVKLGSSFPFSTSRAAKALGCMFTPRQVELAHPARCSSTSSTRRPDPPTAYFDAGLINPDSSLRPGYDVVKSRKARSCHK